VIFSAQFLLFITQMEINPQMGKHNLHGKRKGGPGMKRVILMAFLILATTSFSTMAVEMADVGGLNSDVPNFVGNAPNRIVVKFDPPTLRGIDKAAMARGRTGLPVLDQVGTLHGVRSLRPQFPGAKQKSYKGKVIDLSGWHEVEFAGREDVLAVVEHYKAVPGVLDAQPVGIHKVNREPNDWNYIYDPHQWHLPRIQAPQAWDIETGNSDIIVAVMDTGVRYFHRDLGGANASFSNPSVAEGNMWINTAERYGNVGVDDDGNGHVDDWIGWDFVHVLDNWPLMQCFPGEDCLDPDNDPRDYQGHGTHCAGNVSTMNNNSYSQASVAGGWGDGNFVGGPGNGVRVMDLRIGWRAIYGVLFDVGMVDMGFAAQALQYAADKGARIASCSWGSDNSGGIGEAIDYFVASGGLIFKAAGNDSTETADYLCARNDVLCVAATDQNDCKASFSTYGSWVDISAPGVGIWSSWHNPDDPVPDYISTMDGTSMSTPLSASVAALIWSRNPTWTAAQVRQRLFDSADPIDSLPCNFSFGGKLGAGRINAFKAVGTASPPSPPVADFSASPTSGVAPLDVNFSDLSTGNITSWSWNFGDGYGATLRNPSHTYEFPGTYTVSLTVSGESGSNAKTKPDYITVNEPPEQHQAVVTSIGTGIYTRSGKTRIFHPQLDFIQGDEVVIRARVDDSTNGAPINNAVVVIGITGPKATTLTSGPSDSNGIAEARWKTSAPRRNNSGTTPGSYTATVNNVTASGYTWDGIQKTTAFTVNSK
jgi:PKD repeat protein